MEEHIKKSEIGNETEKEKDTFIKWVKAHKKELIFAGISIASLIGIIFGIKNKDSIEALWATLQKSVAKLPADKAVVKVTENVIPLVETVSTTNITLLEKIAAAVAYGIELLPGQTWVENYTKGTIAA